MATDDCDCNGGTMGHAAECVRYLRRDVPRLRAEAAAAEARLAAALQYVETMARKVARCRDARGGRGGQRAPCLHAYANAPLSMLSALDRDINALRALLAGEGGK